MIIKLNSPSISLPAGLPSLLTEPGSVQALHAVLWALVTDPNRPGRHPGHQEDHAHDRQVAPDGL